jgi:transposase
MVSSVLSCPFCHQPERVVKHGTNRGGTNRLRCLTCRKTFTPNPNPRRVTEDTEANILAALSERLSIEAIARLLKVGKPTIYRTLKKSGDPRAGDPDAPRKPA